MLGEPVKGIPILLAYVTVKVFTYPSKITSFKCRLFKIDFNWWLSFQPSLTVPQNVMQKQHIFVNYLSQCHEIWDKADISAHRSHCEGNNGKLLFSSTTNWHFIISSFRLHYSPGSYVRSTYFAQLHKRSSKIYAGRDRITSQREGSQRITFP